MPTTAIAATTASTAAADTDNPVPSTPSPTTVPVWPAAALWPAAAFPVVCCAGGCCGAVLWPTDRALQASSAESTMPVENTFRMFTSPRSCLWAVGPLVPDLVASAVTLRGRRYMQDAARVNPHCIDL